MLKYSLNDCCFILTPIISWSRFRLLFFVLIFVWIMLIVSLITSENIMSYLRLRSESALLYAQRSKLQAAHSRLFDLHLQAKHLVLEIDAAVKRLGVQDLPAFTHKVGRLASRHKVQVTAWKTLIVQHHILYNEIVIQLSVKGTYVACILLLKELLRLKQVLSLDNIRIDQALSSKILRLHFTLKLYQLPHLDTHKDTVDFLGLLLQGKRIWAIVCLPGCHIQHVQVGDSIGHGFGSIVSINAKFLLTTKNKHFILHGVRSGCCATSSALSL